MRILVIEDKQKHRDSARETLAGHELTIACSFDEAMSLMSERADKKMLDRLQNEEGLNYSQAWKRSVLPFPFDAVLTDMMMPMCKGPLNSDVFNPDEQVPYGFVLALKAASRGAKFVAMVTDTNHHHGAMSAALDRLSGDGYRGPKHRLMIDGARAMFVHTPFLRDVVGKKPCEYCRGSGVCKPCNGTGRRNDRYVQGECNCCREDVGKCSSCEGSGQADIVRYDRKDWGRVLADLIVDEPELRGADKAPDIW